MNFEQYANRLDLIAKVSRQARSRADEASNVIKRSSTFVLGGRRSGRKYKVPGTRRTYVASAPKESPAARTRTKGFRYSWYKNTEGIDPGVETTKPDIARIMTKGAKRKNGYLQRRPFVRKVKQRSMRTLRRIYRRPYLNG